MRHPSVEPWAQRPVAEIIDHVLQVYHQPLFLELRRLELLLREFGPAVAAPQGRALRESFHELRGELEQHMTKEETVLFPWLRSGQGPSAGAPVRVAHDEHEAVARHLRALCELLPPDAAAARDRALLALRDGLVRVEASLSEQIQLEEEVLFPRGLGRD